MFSNRIKHYNIDTDPMGDETLIKTYPKNMSKDGKKTYQRMGWKDDGLKLGPLGLQFLPKGDGDGDGDEEDHVLVGRGNLKLSMSFVAFSVLGDDACTKRNVCLSSVSSLSLSVSHLHIHTHIQRKITSLVRDFTNGNCSYGPCFGLNRTEPNY